MPHPQLVLADHKLRVPALYEDNTSMWYSADATIVGCCHTNLQGNNVIKARWNIKNGAWGTWTHSVAQDTWSAAIITHRRWRLVCLLQSPVGERFMISRHPRTNKLKQNNILYYTSSLFSFPCVYISKPSPPFYNLRRVSSSTTPSSAGLQLLKQKHLITAEATRSYVCLLCVWLRLTNKKK